MRAGSIANPKSPGSRDWVRVVWAVAAWLWSIVAGGGGLLLLIEKGPLPITNGWFALMSGLCACPLTAVVLRRLAGVSPSGLIRLYAAAAFFIAGRIALLIRL